MHDKLERFPLRQAVRLTSPVPAAFPAEGVVGWLSKPDEYVAFVRGEEITLCAASPAAMDEARTLLRQVHGGAAAVGPVAVHALENEDGQCMEPIMSLRITAGREHAIALLALMNERGADVRDVLLQPGRCVIRGEAPLAKLLDWEPAARAASGGTVHIVSWLSRYEVRAAEVAARHS